MNKIATKLIAIISLFSLIFPLAGQAIDFDYNYIISDAEAQAYDSMSQVEIKDFFLEKNSYLSTYWYFGDNPGPYELRIDPEADYFKKRTATEIIYNAAQESKINPQFLITMLQKEMGIVEDLDPVENQLAYAMGYGCPDGGGCNFKYKGFGKQVRATAQQFRYFLDNIYEYKHQPGIPRFG